jgi:hypothetical protein
MQRATALRNGDVIGTWASATILLAGVVASSLPAEAARLLGMGLLASVGVFLVATGLVNLRAALARDGRDLGPILLSTLLPIMSGVVVAVLGTSAPVAEIAARGAGVLTALLGLALLLPPTAPTIVFSRASGRRRIRRTAVR